MTQEKPQGVALIDVWRMAARIRVVDEAIRDAINQGRYRSIYYSPCGQEVVAAAIGVSLRPDDWMVTNYRGIHDQLAKGVPLEPLIAELWGRRTGVNGGKGGPMHVADPASGVMLTTGIVGGGLPIANGLALAASFGEADRICVVCFGDGATNIGAFHEALNLAAVWDLPVVFVCQNNGYAEFTPREETQRVEPWQRAAAYGMPGEAVDDTDVDALVGAITTAVGRARAGAGPTLVECRTSRFMGHFYGEPMVYLDKDVLTARMADDALVQLRRRVIESGLADESALASYEDEQRGEVAAAIDLAVSAPAPSEADLLTDVYAAVPA